jgi:hypothetical protein
MIKLTCIEWLDELLFFKAHLFSFQSTTIIVIRRCRRSLIHLCVQWAKRENVMWVSDEEEEEGGGKKWKRRTIFSSIYHAICRTNTAKSLQRANDRVWVKTCSREQEAWSAILVKYSGIFSLSSTDLETLSLGSDSLSLAVGWLGWREGNEERFEVQWISCVCVWHFRQRRIYFHLPHIDFNKTKRKINDMHLFRASLPSSLTINGDHCRINECRSCFMLPPHKMMPRSFALIHTQTLTYARVVINYLFIYFWGINVWQVSHSLS